MKNPRKQAAGSLGGKALKAAQSPEERRAQSTRGYLRGAVNTLTRRADELSVEDRDRLLSALTASARRQ